MKEFNARLGLTAGLVVIGAILVALYLWLQGVDALEGRNPFQFFADSNTYHEISKNLGTASLGDLVSVTRNTLGPLVITMLGLNNYYLISIINFSIFFVSVWMVARDFRVDPLIFAVILLLNPLSVSSLMSVNKEVISLLCFAFLARAWIRKSLVWLVMAAMLAFCVRWQFLAVVVVLSALGLGWRFSDRFRPLQLVALIFGISVAYVLFLGGLEGITDNFRYGASSYEGSGLFVYLVEMQMNGFYFLALPIKAAHLLFGLGLRFDRLMSPTNYYNDVWQLLHSTAMLVMFAVLMAKRLINWRDDVFFVSLIYIIIFAVTPIYAPRYFYVVYVMWALVLCVELARTKQAAAAMAAE